jgi:hypothetical protein
MMLQKNASVADHWLRFLIVWCYDRAQINCMATSCGPICTQGNVLCRSET